LDEDGALRVGGAALATSRAGVGVSNAMRNGNASVVSVLRGQTGALEAAAHCASRGWMTILVGPPASGKTSVAQCLADLAGRTLRRVALTAATDTSELLGSFEQKEPARDRAALEEVVSTALRRVAADALGSFPGFASSEGGEEDVEEEKRDQKREFLLDVVERAWSKWSAYESIVDAASRGARAEDAASAKEALSAVVDAVAEARALAASLDATEGGTIRDAMDVDGDETSGDVLHDKEDPVVSSIRERLSTFGPEAWGGAAPSAGRFEWVDGVLLKAATLGEWVLLENANLCSPTVLDRLNPLLETGGSLLVSECGHGSDGEPRIVRAHPEFRLILALDPRRGEVSRAMRNRGVEVFMSGGEDDDSVRDAGKSSESSENSSALDVKGQSLFEDDPSAQTLTNVDDLEGVLAAAGVPAGAPRRAMARAHRALVNGDVLESSDLSPESISSETDEAFRKRLANARAIRRGSVL
jgi:midasin